MSLSRLHVVLARAGVASRRSAEQMILAGRVKVNGAIVNEVGAKIDPLVDRVSLDDEDIGGAEPPVTIVMNKPVQVLSTLDDDRGRESVRDLVRAEPYKLRPVGRLDYHTEGVLLMTTDGELAHRLLHPSHHIPKTYVVKIGGHPTEKALDQLRSGVELEEGITRPAVVEKTETDGPNSWLELIVTEGRNRLVRRMCEAVDHRPLRVIRTGFATISASDLRPGEYRYLTRAELGTLYSVAGMSAPSERGDARREESGLVKLGEARRRKGRLPGEERASDFEPREERRPRSRVREDREERPRVREDRGGDEGAFDHEQPRRVWADGERPSRPRREGDRDRPFRPRREEGDRPFRPRREEGDRPFRPRREGDGERSFRPRREDGDRPRRDFKPRREGDGDRPFRPRREEGDRPFRPRREDGDRPRRDFKPRREGDGDRPFRPRREEGDRPFRPRREDGDRPRRDFKPRREGDGDRPFRPRREGDGDRPFRPRREGDGDRPFRPRREGDRDRPARPRREEGDRPFRPRREEGDRPRRDFKPRREGEGERSFRPRREGARDRDNPGRPRSGPRGGTRGRPRSGPRGRGRR